MSDLLMPSESPPTTDLLVSGVLGASWQEQDQVLRTLWMDGKTPQAIAETLDRSVSAIMTRAARLGLPRRNAPGRKARQPLPEDMETETAATQKTMVARGSRPSKTPTAIDTTQPAASTAARVCLMCLRTFQSAGRHNRICLACKGSSEYITATTLPDIHLPQT